MIINQEYRKLLAEKDVCVVVLLSSHDHINVLHIVSSHDHNV